MSMGESIEFRCSLDLPRDAEMVGVTRRTLDGALAGAGVAADCRADIALALTEACGNAVIHAELAGAYHVEVEVTGGLCTIEVTDDGGGFVPDRAGDPQPLGESGRGLHVIAALTEQLDVITVDDVGTVLRFSKRLTWEA
jgi:serine/threonine-protein kinase RsbW